ETKKFFEFLQSQGYLRVWIDHEIVRVDVDPKKLRLGARVQVIQDRIEMSDANRARLTEALETALRFGKDRINIVDLATKTEHPFSTGWHCAHCDIDIRPPSTGLFSFNNPLGACPECRGFGRTIAIDLNKALPDRSLSIKQGVVRVFRGNEFGESQRDLLRACAREEIDVDLPFEELPKADQNFVINGERENDDIEYDENSWYGVRGFFKWAESKTYKMHMRVLLSRYRAYTTCPKCNGGRFQPDALNYKISVGAAVSAANQPKAAETAASTVRIVTLPEFQALAISDVCGCLGKIDISPNDKTAAMLRGDICARLNYLCEVGVGYLTLDRSTKTLSGGEVQRVNLTTCLGASLVNTLFVMDEPSIGLHPRDVGRLVRVMHGLREKGKTLLVVEHEEQIIRAADNLIDLGPGRGERGGELMWSGPLDDFLGNGDAKCQRGKRVSSVRRVASDQTPVRDRDVASGPHDAGVPSLTRDYLTNQKSIPLPPSRRRWASSIRITGARQHNLKNIDVEIPLGVFACVTGVSGSGKSTLVHDVLYRNLLRAKGRPVDQEAGACRSLSGAHQIGDVIMVDQTPL